MTRFTAMAATLAVFLPSTAEANTSLKGVVPELVAKVQEIQSRCPGVKIVSTIDKRPNKSNHPKGRAVDIVGNPKCAYAVLKEGWKGGYTTDYSTAKHIHISYNPGGQEWGLRFVHGYGKHRQHRTVIAAVDAYPTKEKY